MVEVTTYVYDALRVFQVDVEMYRLAGSMKGGKNDPEFKKMTDLALGLIDKSLE